jgi:serine/threonine protein kinase
MSRAAEQPDADNNSSDAELEAAIAAYLEGGAADPAALAAHPELGGFFAQHKQLVALGSWWRQATGEEQGGDAAPLPTLPGYEIIREIARGGMGIVYEARQTSLNRPVALKLILHGALASDSDRRRFAAEAAAAAKLKHPGIVVIHEVGEHAGQPFFSMEHVAGDSLSRILHNGPVSPKQAAHYAAEVARALQFAHDHGVLHRDVKPSNVLVDDAGRVRVTDFGLAKQVNADDKLTVTGQLLGTPSYMAPEQITGPATAIGPAADIYGLGALLYELLTGQPPFRGATPVETLIQALDSDPQSPRRLNPNIPRPLEMIALKCLERNPADRYASAACVAADLDRFLQGETLSISSPNLLDRVVRTLERSQFDREIHALSRMLFYVAWIAGAAHVGIFATQLLRPAHPLAWELGLRIAELGGMAFVFWCRRAEWYPPRGAAARQLTAIWIGYLACCGALYVVDYIMDPAGQRFYGLGAYPPMAVLAAFVFMVLGSSYWGYCYVLAGVFLGLAVVMTAWLPAAPLIFGLFWAACLVLLAIRLGRLADAA